MPVRSLPQNPSLENLKKQAKALHKSVRGGDAEAVARVHEFHPHAALAVDDFKLADAQLVIARSYRFLSWAKLRERLAVIDRHGYDPAPEGTDAAGDESLADTFLRLACLDYGRWRLAHAEKARRMLAEHPELSAANILTAAAVGDVAATRRLLAASPRLARARGGPHPWEPILYLCYSRLDSPDPRHSAVETARELLAHGADPNAGFLWRGNVPPFTALTGAFGSGEGDAQEPGHPEGLALARVLLEAGADPNDGQTLYNRHFRANDDHLKLLLAYGLGQDKGGPWLRRMDAPELAPARLLVEELWAAARKGFMDRVQLLVAHGTDVNAPGERNGRTPYEVARLAGHDAIAEYLVRRGARRVELARDERFAVACVTGRRDETRALLEEDPTLVERLGKDGRTELLHRAVESHRIEGVRLMADLGFELSERTTHRGVGMNRDVTPMHNAAWSGQLEMVKLLVERGADPGVREPEYHSTPLGWAQYNQQTHVVEYLLAFADLFDAVEAGAVERVSTVLRENPASARTTDAQGRGIAFHLQPGPRVGEIVSLLVAHGADLNARGPKGKTPLDHLSTLGSQELIDIVRAQGARTARELGEG